MSIGVFARVSVVSKEHELFREQRRVISRML